jgi:hypothetical protein
LSKALEGAALLGAAVGMGALAMLDPAVLAMGPLYGKIMLSLALGGISMEAGAIASALTSNRGSGITVRQSAAYRPIIYGTRMVGGSMIYCSTTGSHHDQYNLVIVLAGHECSAIENLYLDGRKVFWNTSSFANTTRNGINFGGSANGTGYVGPDGSHYNFGGLVFCEARWGDQLDGDVMTSLNANDPNWAPSAEGSPYVGGCCYVYLKVEYDANMFPTQPEIRFTVDGKNNIWDPRTSTYGFTDNWALCVADILTDTSYGVGAVQAAINQAQLIAAANVCDEQIPLANPTVEGVSEAQFTCNWTGDTATAPGDILAQIMPAAGGRMSKIGGQYFIWPAYFQGPGFTFDANSLVAPISWTPYRSTRDLNNRVKGTYVAPFFPYAVSGNLYDKNGYYDGTTANLFPLAWQPTDYPYYAEDVEHGYSSDQWLIEDGGVVHYQDLNQQACISLATSQRIAKIELLRNRFQGSGTFSMALDAYQMQPTDVMGFSLPLYGWVDKMLEVTSVKVAIGGGQGAPSIQVQVEVRETDPSIYEWSITEEQSVTSVPALALNPPYVVDPPTGLTLSHQTVTFGVGSSGSGILVTWTPSDDGFVVSTSISYMVSGGSTFTSAGSVPQANTQSGIAPLGSGTYTVEVVAVRANGASSAPTTATITF